MTQITVWETLPHHCEREPKEVNKHVMQILSLNCTSGKLSEERVWSEFQNLRIGRKLG